MSHPLIVRIPHNLSRAEVTRRLKDGFLQLHHKFGDKLLILKDEWTDDHLAFHVRALGQSASGTIDVADDHVLLTVELPWLLATLAQKAKGSIQQQGQLLLEKK